MGKLIMIVTILYSAQSFSDTYDKSFAKEVAQITAKTFEVTKEAKAQELGIEDLETMRQSIEG